MIAKVESNEVVEKPAVGSFDEGDTPELSELLGLSELINNSELAGLEITDDIGTLELDMTVTGAVEVELGDPET